MNKMMSFFFVILSFLINVAIANEYKIGVYYYPGWKDYQPHATSNKPWTPIKNFPDRKPLSGWYPDGDGNIMEQQIDWMKNYSIKYVVFDWYFGAPSNIYLEHALNAYLSASNNTGLQFSILWANNDGILNSQNDWFKIVDYWINNYFNKKQFLTIDGKPVVFIADAGTLINIAVNAGMDMQEMLALAQQRAINAGYPGIYFVGGTGAYIPMITTVGISKGLSAFSAYNYHSAPDDIILSHSFAELDAGYQKHWARFISKSSLPYIIPMTSGWDKRAWGGSTDPMHDNSFSTPDEFQHHLLAAKAIMDANPVKTMKLGVICCWNEYGEGSVIEPTEKFQTDFLQKIKDVFGDN